ncbi:Hypothetical predicted protein [Cloeon dipterum]|uniref:C2H2-type domain-containing protein n=1 Tax=Cloeon dipterum TaxID=197152 RepID=A0A8S1CQB3_9INSE|nr:Hypothetical predicted protein [Cloeon dipterum]
MERPSEAIALNRGLSSVLDHNWLLSSIGDNLFQKNPKEEFPFIDLADDLSSSDCESDIYESPLPYSSGVYRLNLHVEVECNEELPISAATNLNPSFTETSNKGEPCPLPELILASIPDGDTSATATLNLSAEVHPPPVAASTSGDLQPHVELEGRVRCPFLCRNRKQAYANLASLKQHMRKLHANYVPCGVKCCNRYFLKSQEGKQCRNDHLDKDYPGKVNCRYCGKQFSDTHLLRHHLISSH